jgi:hypothetical protein
VDDGDQDYFGWSVSISGDYAIIGAKHHDEGDNTAQNIGAAYIYGYNPTADSWEENRMLLPGDGSTSDWFGIMVAITGNHALVGTNSGSYGNVYVYAYDAARQIWE